MSGQFVISLDFELLWGVRDHADRAKYGANVLGARVAVPRMLELFEKFGIAATWATVGFLFCESKDELLESLPEDRPTYKNSALSNYSYLDEVGQNEAADPYYFAPSLIERIRQTPGQEIATHTLSHYYCLEDGQAPNSFDADLRAACILAKRRGIELRSIVFPRNQFAPEHLDICEKHGITAYRGNENSWAYRAAPGSGQTPLRRGLRLLDAYTGMLGPHISSPIKERTANIPASRFLRPRSGRLARLQPMHVGLICREMRAAARTGKDYHLWWHPHNFGRDLEDNIKSLKKIAIYFNRLRDEFGMTSKSMGEICG